MPKTTQVLICENGYFTVNEDLVIRMISYREVDQDKCAELQAELDSLEHALKSAMDTFEMNDIQGQINRVERDLKRELNRERTASYECRLKSEWDLSRWIEIARSAKDSVRSCAYKTGLRFDSPDNDNPDLDLKDVCPVVFPREWIYTGVRR